MNNIMAEEKNKGSEAVDNSSGSPENLIQSSPSANDAGGELGVKSEAKEEINLDDYIPKQDYEELEKKLGEQGTELGEARTFIKGIEPLLDKLQEQPELVEGILSGKIDSKLAESVMEGKFSVEDAKNVTEAHKEVKKELGKERYENLRPEQIEELVSKKVSEAINETTKNLKRDISTIEEKRGYEKKVEDFVKNTDDFSEHAEDVVKWLEDHPDQYDIETAYLAVKGKRILNTEVEDRKKKEAEEAKNIALNASGGGSQGGKLEEDRNIIDELIANKPNPNTF